MTKEFNHDNFKFIIKVALDVEIERSPNGKRWSEVGIKHIGTPEWRKDERCLTISVASMIEELENAAKLFANQELRLSQMEKTLLTMGFEIEK
jgi:hypothetical protein